MERKRKKKKTKMHAKLMCALILFQKVGSEFFSDVFPLDNYVILDQSVLLLCETVLS